MKSDEELRKLCEKIAKVIVDADVTYFEATAALEIVKCQIMDTAFKKEGKK